MYTVELIKEEISSTYKIDNEIIPNPTPEQKLSCAIFGNCFHTKTETVVDTWKVKTKKLAEPLFWDFFKINPNEDASNYYLNFT